MKLLLSFALVFFACLNLKAESAQGDWVMLDLKNGTQVHGYVVQVTESNIHLVGASINRLIAKDQLSDESLKMISERFAVIVPTDARETKTATILKEGLREQRQRLYQQVSDVYSSGYRKYSTSIFPYPHYYYHPSPCSISYPVYRHYHRPYYHFPRWCIQIDL